MRQTEKPQPQQGDYFAKKRECFELATKQATRDEQATTKTPNISGIIELKPEQCYVPSMNTCTYESGFIYAKGKSSMTVEDLLTGQVLAGGPGDDPAYKREETVYSNSVRSEASGE